MINRCPAAAATAAVSSDVGLRRAVRTPAKLYNQG